MSAWTAVHGAIGARRLMDMVTQWHFFVCCYIGGLLKKTARLFISAILADLSQDCGHSTTVLGRVTHHLCHLSNQLHTSVRILADFFRCVESLYTKMQRAPSFVPTAKYAKETKYAVYYYVDRFEKCSNILNCVNMRIMHYYRSGASEASGAAMLEI